MEYSSFRLQYLMHCKDIGFISTYRMMMTNMLHCIFSSQAHIISAISSHVEHCVFPQGNDLITRCKVPVENALRDAKLSLDDMDEVILVGGSTRIPAVRALVKKLTGKEVKFEFPTTEGH